jgi:signal transduction histidine kinase
VLCDAFDQRDWKVTLEPVMTLSDLVDRLAAHRTIGCVPREQLQWLAAHGELRQLAPGEVLSPRNTPEKSMHVVLSGLLSISIDHGAGRRRAMEWRGGEVTGVLPYSRLKSPPGDVVADEPTDVLSLDRSNLGALVAECHDLTEVLVHVMLDRARSFRSGELLDEKLLSLGRLAAGLAHELNNPASAAARSAATLADQLREMQVAGRAMSRLELSREQDACVEELHTLALADARVEPSLLANADREEALADWLEAHELGELDPVTLARSGVSVADLERFAAILGQDTLAATLRLVVAEGTLRQLAAEVQVAASRIHALVAAVKGFTHMDQAPVRTPVDVGRGLADTVIVLTPKARGKDVDLRLDLAPRLPMVDGFGGQLNQVWANLIDNALDAVAPGGHVVVTARREERSLLVSVADDGPGIPPEIRDLLFDPFFTTKPIGQGMGLGLDVARRLVRGHEGEIDLRTGTGGTEFQVRLPLPARTAAKAER